MTRRRTAWLLTVATSALLASCPWPIRPRVACVDFEPPLAAGTRYGAPVGNAPGDRVLVQNRIAMQVESFAFIAGGGTFDVASVDARPLPNGSSQSLRSNNIALRFDFTKLPFSASRASFEFLDLGGFENLGVNGSAIVAGELSGAPPSLGGASVSVTTAPAPGGRTGTVQLAGGIQSLVVGGQELWIDQVCARR
jgi:hypothetical protein